MHNRLRMITASFLVKDLHLDWTAGARFFMDHLVDGDLPSNNHGWQWVAGTGTDAAPYFRIFNPTRQSEKFDPDGTYIRRWVPELAERRRPAPSTTPPPRPDGPPPGYPAPDRRPRHRARRVPPPLPGHPLTAGIWARGVSGCLLGGGASRCRDRARPDTERAPIGGSGRDDRRSRGGRRGRRGRASVAGPGGRSAQASSAAATYWRAVTAALSTPSSVRTMASALSRSASSSGRPSSEASSLPALFVHGQRPQDGQRVDALDEVVAGRLAELLGGVGDVEDVVDDLEHHPERVAPGGQRVDRRDGRARRRCRRCGRRCRTATPSCPGSTRGSCPRTCVMSYVWRSCSISPSHSQPIVRASSPATSVPSDGGDLRRPREQEVAGEDRLQVPPLGVDGLDAAAGVGLVEHVVVVERAEVDQLAGDAAAHDVVGRRRAADLGGGDRHDRPQPLAPGDDEVRGDLGEVVVRAADGLVERVLDPSTVGVDRRRREQRRPHGGVGHTGRLVVRHRRHPQDGARPPPRRCGPHRYTDPTSAPL